MTQFDEFIKAYSSGFYLLFSKEEKKEWTEADNEIAREYLRKYYLADSEYNHVWRPKQQETFFPVHYPEYVFKRDFQIIPGIGGAVFVEDDFNKFMQLLKAINEREFVIIQYTSQKDCPRFQMKYPTDITWDEINNGAFISSTLLNMPHYDYLVFGHTPMWAKYVDNEPEIPVDLIAYDKSYSDAVESQFSQIDDEVFRSLPAEYRSKVSQSLR